MRETGPDLRSIDLPGLCQRGTRLEGRQPLAVLQRLATALAAPAEGVADWSAQGSQRPVTGGPPENWLHLLAQARVPLQCQRCLQALTESLSVDRRFRFVADEAEAAKLDEASEDDILVLQARLNLLELLEDELILALPLVPRHAVCPQPLLAQGDAAADIHFDTPTEPAAGATDRRPNPFAALAGWRPDVGKDAEDDSEDSPKPKPKPKPNGKREDPT